MKRIIKPFAVLCAAALSFTACKKDAKEAPQDQVPNSTLAQIRALGFDDQGVKKVNGGYLVEGDIVLSDNQLNSSPTSPNMIVAKEEQYRTFNLVSVSKHPNIKVALNNSSPSYDAAFTAALDEAVRRYNAEGLQISFTRVATTQSPDITVVAFYQV